MSIDLGQTVDDFYQGQSTPTEVIKMIRIALLREQQGQTAEQIGIELNLPSERAKELVIRAKGWELERSNKKLS